jgi:A/G-specific adenine glycosylase
MLQQTQAERVTRHFGPFLERFPGFAALARATVEEVLRSWQGLGYNRRALALLEAARRVMDEQGGVLPAEERYLRSLPGVGPYTAAAVLAFAFERPVVLIETNIRRAFIHEFFPEAEGVRDAELVPLVAATLEQSRPREWYYALMDYGAALRAAGANPNRRSAGYRPQPRFEGSQRQVRGAILKALLGEGPRGEEHLARMLAVEPHRLRCALEHLEREGFVVREGNTVRLRQAPRREPLQVREGETEGGKGDEGGKEAGDVALPAAGGAGDHG